MVSIKEIDKEGKKLAIFQKLKSAEAINEIMRMIPSMIVLKRKNR